MDRLTVNLGGYRILRHGSYGPEVAERAKRDVLWAELQDLNAEPGRASTFIVTLGRDVDPQSLPTGDQVPLLLPATVATVSAGGGVDGKPARLKLRVDVLVYEGMRGLKAA
jgi:hypothetical protein